MNVWIIPSSDHSNWIIDCHLTKYSFWFASISEFEGSELHSDDKEEKRGLVLTIFSISFVSMSNLQFASWRSLCLSCSWSMFMQSGQNKDGKSWTTSPSGPVMTQRCLIQFMRCNRSQPVQLQAVLPSEKPVTATVVMITISHT